MKDNPKDKKNMRKNAQLSNDSWADSGLAVSATEFTGMVPAIGEDGLEDMSDAYAELYGIPDPGITMAEHDPEHQIQMPQI